MPGDATEPRAGKTATILHPRPGLQDCVPSGAWPTSLNLSAQGLVTLLDGVSSAVQVVAPEWERTFILNLSLSQGRLWAAEQLLCTCMCTCTWGVGPVYSLWLRLDIMGCPAPDKQSLEPCRESEDEAAQKIP